MCVALHFRLGHSDHKNNLEQQKGTGRTNMNDQNGQRMIQKKWTGIKTRHSIYRIAVFIYTEVSGEGKKKIAFQPKVMDSVWNKRNLSKNHFEKLSLDVVKTLLILLWDRDVVSSSLLYFLFFIFRKNYCCVRQQKTYLLLIYIFGCYFQLIIYQNWYSKTIELLLGHN